MLADLLIESGRLILAALVDRGVREFRVDNAAFIRVLDRVRASPLMLNDPLSGLVERFQVWNGALGRESSDITAMWGMVVAARWMSWISPPHTHAKIHLSPRAAKRMLENEVSMVEGGIYRIFAQEFAAELAKGADS